MEEVKKVDKDERTGYAREEIEEGKGKKGRGGHGSDKDDLHGSKSERYKVKSEGKNCAG